MMPANVTLIARLLQLLTSLCICSSAIALAGPTICADCPVVRPVPFGPSPRFPTGKVVRASETLITFRQWALCTAEFGCDRYNPDRQGLTDDMPVVNVSFDDAQRFIEWLSRKSGKHYRLPYESEWGHLALGGRGTKYPWGNKLLRNRTNCLECGSKWDGRSPSPVRTFTPNDYGLFDPVGNVAQWVAPDPDSASAAPSRCAGKRAQAAIFGASWADRAQFLETTEATCFPRILRDDTIGFRVVEAGPMDDNQPIMKLLVDAPTGARVGFLVTDSDGKEVLSSRPDERFVPASTTKLFTTAAAFMNLVELDKPERIFTTSVRLERANVILVGHGDARLVSAADCRSDCLGHLADAVAAKTSRVTDVIGDASFLTDQRWSDGMGWNNIAERSGAAASALTLNDNVTVMDVVAGRPGEKPEVEIEPYFRVRNHARTVSDGTTTLHFQRLPLERVVYLTGTIMVGAPSQRFELAIDDPARYAAWTFARLLKARGVNVRGSIRSVYRSSDDRKAQTTRFLARLTAPPLLEDITRINKVSQTLHAEMLLRRVGVASGDGSVTSGIEAIGRMLGQAGISPLSYNFADGSGISTYNRITPRAAVAFLNWTSKQPWGLTYQSTLAVAGTDGTLERRFRGTVLEGKMSAKTGSLTGTAALAGWMTAKSGKRLTFSIFVNDIPQGQIAAPLIDATLVAIAEAQ